MCKIFPNSPRFKTLGEENLYNKILSFLPADWFIFYEPFINGRNPDFILFNLNYGLAVIEVKDYSKNTIKKINPTNWEITVNNSVKSVTSPLQQVSNYRNEIIDLLSKNKNLLIDVGDYKGNLKIPIFTFCCFSALNQNDIENLKISNIIPKDLLITKEDLYSVENFRSKIFMQQKRLFKPKNVSSNDIKYIIETFYPSFSFQEDDELVQKKLPSISNNKENSHSILNKRFDHYIDEIMYITDFIAHCYNSHEVYENIVIFYISDKSIVSNNFINTLVDFLKHKNIEFEFNNSIKQSSKIQIVSYNLFKQANLNNKLIVLTSFEFLPKNKQSEISQAIQYLTNSSFLITSTK